MKVKRRKKLLQVIHTVDVWEDVEHDTNIYYKDFVHMDEDLAVCSVMTHVEIVADDMKIRNNCLFSDHEGDQPEIPDIPIPKSSQAPNSFTIEMVC